MVSLSGIILRGEPHSKRERMFSRIDRRLFTILMIVFVQMLGASMIWPILPLFARNEFEISENVATLLFTSFFAAQFLAGPVLGRLSDIYGRLPVLIISQIGTVISFAMMVFAPSVEWLFISRVLDGVTGGNIIVAQAYVADVTPPKQRTQAFGYIFASFGAAFMIGPAVGGILTSALGPRIPFLIAAIAAALTVLLTWLALDESVTAEQRAANRVKSTASIQPRQVMRNVPLMLVMVIGFGIQFSAMLFFSTFAFFGEDVLFQGFDAQQTSLGIGILIGFVGLGQIMTQFLVLKRLLRRLLEGRIVILGTLTYGIALLILMTVGSPLAAAPIMAMLAIGSGIATPSLQSLATGTVDDELRGGVLGVLQSSSSLAMIAGTALAGSLFAVSARFPMITGGVVSLSLALPALYLYRDQARRKLAAEQVVATS